MSLLELSVRAILTHARRVIGSTFVGKTQGFFLNWLVLLTDSIFLIFIILLIFIRVLVYLILQILVMLGVTV